MTGFKEKIIAIKNDHSHGSTILLQEIIDVFLAKNYSDNEILWAHSELGKLDPSMVVIHHFLKKLKPSIGNDFQNHVQQYQEAWQNVNKRITKNLMGYLANDSFTILTHSHSGVVIDVLKHLLENGYSIEVFQTESQPGGEGIIQAKALRQSGIDVTIIKDESIINIIDQINYCFLGVDQYDENSFVNKKGSKTIVELAKQNKVPVFVLGDTRKKVHDIKLGNEDLFEIVSLIGNVRILAPEG